MSDGVQTMNTRGQWVPAIPIPFYRRLSVQCECGRRFRHLLHPFGGALKRYREHYAYHHILGL